MRPVLITFFSVIILIISACMIYLTPQASANRNDYKFSPDAIVSDDSYNKNQAMPDIAVTADGKICVVWIDGRKDINSNDIYFSKSTDGGNSYGDGITDTDVMINDDTEQASQKAPAIATDNNDILVVWTDSRSGYEHIFFSKSTDGGATFGTNKRVDDAPNDINAQYPDIAVTSTGTICVVWQDYRNGNLDIFYAESTDGGANFQPHIRADGSGTNISDQKYPKIAIGGSDDKYVVWQDYRNKNYDIFCAHASSSTPTSSFDPDVRVDSSTGNSDQTRPTVGAYGASDVYVAWCDKRIAPAGDIYFAKSTNKGLTFGSDFRIDKASSTTPLQDYPDLAVNTEGVIHVVWKDHRSSRNADTRSSRASHKIYCINSTDGGSTFSNTDIRVDDTGSTTENGEKFAPAITVRGTKNIYVAWQDRRNGNDDIYSSFWGKASEMVGTAPKLTNGLVKNGTTGEDIEVAGIQDELKFLVTYTDIENDPPAAGFPKLYIYTDQSLTTQAPSSPFTMSVQLAEDGDYTNGETYYRKIILNEEHDYYYQFEAKAETGNLTVVQSIIYLGLKIDNSLPTFSDPTPESNIWVKTDAVECSILISDQGGSGVDLLSIAYRSMKNGTSGFGKWRTNVDHKTKDKGYKCSANISLAEGTENYIQWNATDKIGKRYGLYNISELFEVKVDTTPVIFNDPIPDVEYWQNKKLITCSITISDLGGSGVNASSIEYYYRANGEMTYSGPYSTEVIQNNETIIVSTPEPVSFENGEGNYIKWSASDLVGNLAFSEEFQVKIDITRPTNTPPEAPDWLKPVNTKDSTPRIEWGSGYDADDDILKYYIQIGTISNGNDIVKWTFTGTNKYYNVKSNLIVGSYYTQIKAFDGLDNSSVFQQVMNITNIGEDPPGPPSAIYPNVTSNHKPTITWDGPDDNTSAQIFYFIQIGTTSGNNDIRPWYSTGVEKRFDVQTKLDDGIYYIQLMSANDAGTSFAYEETLKIGSFNPELEVPTEYTVNQGQTASVKITLKNGCNIEDLITLNITGELTTKASVTISTSPQSPMLLQPNETKNITILINLPSDIKVGDYEINIRATSEDGESKSFTHTLILHIKSVDGKKNGDDGVTDESSGDSSAVFLLALIIIIIIIVILVVVAAVAAKKKRSTKEKEDFFREKDEYNKVYGPQRGERGGGGFPPSAGSGLGPNNGEGPGSKPGGKSDYDFYYDEIK